MNHNEGHAIQGMSFLIPIERTQEEHMVKAEITIGTCYGDAVIPVEVVGKGGMIPDRCGFGMIRRVSSTLFHC